MGPQQTLTDSLPLNDIASLVVREFSTRAEDGNGSLPGGLKNQIRVSTGPSGSGKRFTKTLSGWEEKNEQRREESGTWEIAKCREKSEEPQRAWPRGLTELIAMWVQKAAPSRQQVLFYSEQRIHKKFLRNLRTKGQNQALERKKNVHEFHRKETLPGTGSDSESLKKKRKEKNVFHNLQFIFYRPYSLNHHQHLPVNSEKYASLTLSVRTQG